MDKSLFDKYESLLMKKDAFEKEAGGILTKYLHVFGQLIKESFELKIACIELKKKITFCRKERNKGCIPDREKMELFVSEQMQIHYRELRRIIRDTERCKILEVSTRADVLKAKKLYKKIAKMLHPDLKPAIAKNEAALDVWNRAVSAYHKNDAKKLEELIVLANAILISEGFDSDDLEIENIEEKIDNLRNEIEKIKSTDPYAYKFFLDDDDAVEEKKNEFTEEINRYKKYKLRLEQALSILLSSGGEVTFWQTN